MTEAFPLISCLCITQNNTLLLQRAIDCFHAQTYPHKELLIVYEDDNTLTASFLEALPANDGISIFAIPALPKTPLGALRNFSVQMAKGAYVCQWDDDDWYHSERLAVQFELMQQAEKPACVLAQWLLFDGNTRRAYTSCERYWEGSLLCRKDLVLQNQYAGLAKGEDTPAIAALRAAGNIHLVRQQAHLYIYNYHGSNTWHYQHFERFFHYSKLLTPPQSQLVEKALTQKHQVTQASQLLNEAFKINPK